MQIQDELEDMTWDIICEAETEHHIKTFGFLLAF